MVASVAVLSDIHGVLPALEAVLAEPDVRAAELIVATGDHAAGPQQLRHTAFDIEAAVAPSASPPTRSTRAPSQQGGLGLDCRARGSCRSGTPPLMD